MLHQNYNTSVEDSFKKISTDLELIRAGLRARSAAENKPQQLEPACSQEIQVPTNFLTRQTTATVKNILEK